MATTAERQFCIVLLIWTLFVGFTVGLRCYQCVDAAKDDDCRNASLLLDATNSKYKGDDGTGETWRRNTYFKECSNENHTMCMIEMYYSTDGKTKSYNRDCTDGISYSFSTDKHPRLKNLPANNETTCTYDADFAGQHICVVLCQTDMCNGPLLSDKVIKCGNETDEDGKVSYICGASSLTLFQTYPLSTMFTALFGSGALVPFLLYLVGVGIFV